MDRVNLSVLDRLMDAEPRSYKEAVRRDLEWLLNTRRIAEPPPESLRELNRSLYVYGLPDFSAFSLANLKDTSKLQRILETAIAQFEPRLTNLRLVPFEETDQKSRTLRFRIEGLLKMDPAPERVSFDTVLQLTSGRYEVKDAG